MFKIYKSSAGSGKTFTLVKEYLKLALNPTSELTFKRILATTFTNKAANEMKSRVLEALAFLSDPNPKTAKHEVLKSALIKELSISERDLQQQSLKVLRAILHNYADFGIGTIDRFTHRIVRTFARDLNLPANFEIELDEKPIIDQAIDLLLAKIGTDKLLTKFLVQFTQMKVDSGDKYQIESDIQNIAKELLKEEGTVYIKQLRKFGLQDFQSKINRYNKANEDFSKQIESAGTLAIDLIEKSGAKIDSFYRANSGLPAYFSYLKDSRLDKFTPNSYVIETIEDDKWYSTKAKKDADQLSAIDGIKEQLIRIYTEVIQLIESEYSVFVEREIILKNLYSVALINELDKLIGDLRTTENKVHISEFNKRISDVISKEPAPFIYERIGERYQHYLIDEFQDTSVMQFHNLIPLFTNSLSQGHFNMLVGDAKQAIYRFRGGEVEQFVQLPTIYKSEINPTAASSQFLFSETIVLDNLSQNFRSKEEVVNFNTSFFDYCLESYSEIEQLYSGHKQTPKANNTGGYVEVHFCEKPQKNAYEEDKEADDDPEQIEVIIEKIEKCKSDGYQLKDMVLLFRGNTKANQVAKILIDKGYKISSAESVMISNSSSVRLIVNILNTMLYPDEQMYKKAIIDALYANDYFINEQLNDIYNRLLSIPDYEFWKNIGGFAAELDFFKLRQRPLFEIVETIFRTFGLLDDANPYIQFFLDEVFDYALNNNNDVLGFLSWWDQRKDKKSIELPEGLDALNIMTVHKSKGLEFPVVIIPYASDRVKVSGGKWIENDEKEEPIDRLEYISISAILEKTSYKPVYEEEKRNSTIDFFNTLYVAFTRPEDRLYIICNQPAKSSKTANIPSLIQSYLVSKQMWSNDISTYALGGEELKIATKAEEKTTTSKELIEFISRDWNDKLALSYQAPDYWDIYFGEDARQYGNTIHLILALIKTSDDLGKVLEKLLKQGSITKEQRVKYENEIKLLLEQPAFSPYFQKGLKVKTECDLLTPDGKTFRPDRVIYFDDYVKVIDFKTGQASEKHKEQLKNYINLLQEAETQKVKGSLIYIRDLEEIEV